MPRRLTPDRWLAVTTGLLVIGGLLLVGSASHYVAMKGGGSPWALLLRHAAFAVVGVLASLGMLAIPYWRLRERRLVASLLWASAAALVVVLFMPAAGGAHRWFRVGSIGIQPSEFVKIVVIVFAAALLAARADRIHELRAVALPLGAVAGTLAVLVAVEPDLGSAVMMLAPAGAMLFVAGLRWLHIGAGALLACLGGVAAVLAEPYRLQRIRTFLEPSADPRDAGFQLAQSIIAIGSGGWTGAGLGNGQQKAYFLPAPHTDFLFSVLAEELGLVGAALLVAAFVVLLWRGVRTALRSPDPFAFHLSVGLTTLLVLQALVHVGVCLGMLPTKGLPLPFLSYGGSSLVASLAAMGLLLNVSQHAA